MFSPSHYKGQITEKCTNDVTSNTDTAPTLLPHILILCYHMCTTLIFVE